MSECTGSKGIDVIVSLAFNSCTASHQCRLHRFRFLQTCQSLTGWQDLFSPCSFFTLWSSNNDQTGGASAKFFFCCRIEPHSHTLEISWQNSNSKQTSFAFTKGDMFILCISEPTTRVIKLKWTVLSASPALGTLTKLYASPGTYSSFFSVYLLWFWFHHPETYPCQLFLLQRHTMYSHHQVWLYHLSFLSLSVFASSLSLSSVLLSANVQSSFPGMVQCLNHSPGWSPTLLSYLSGCPASKYQDKI